MSTKEERTQRILDAAAEQFTQFGYDRANVSDIALTVGVSKGTLYLHFDSKEAMFEALLIREMERYSQLWFSLIENDPDGGTLAGMYKNVLFALNEVPFMAALIRQDRHVLGSYLAKGDGLLQMAQALEMRSGFIEMMQEAGAIRTDIDAAQIAAVMNVTSYGLVSLEQAANIDATIEAIGKILDAGLTPPDGGNPKAGKAILAQLEQSSTAYFEMLKAELQKRER